jgi:hypothetical protein
MARSAPLEADKAKHKELETKYGAAMKKSLVAPMTAIGKCTANADVKAFGAAMGM